ncbi:hypothetical protein JAAARDRAFT_48882 [Jaapia argillacea MUCL 33604]|uniref:Uncharacterized protein n=1 Tax=Jaapia argillacea MUCL 33604 TaxID=933084 RepID=A0A067PUY0_9AGAM|nr:hypothetical protein JAAARDRAFT_48882 [Jaapia argillacea MUCL 33604]
MRNLALVPIIAIGLLAFATNSAHAFLFFVPPIIRFPCWSNCRWGWFFIIPWVQCNQAGGTSSAAAPPLVCAADQFKFNGACRSRDAWCADAPNTITIASSNAPCTCGKPGDTVTAPKQICADVAHGTGYCSTAGDAPSISSSCKIKCQTGWQIDGTGTKCLQSTIGPGDCDPTQTMGMAGFGQGCTCVSMSAPVAPQQACPDMIKDASGSPHGYMTCKVQADGTGSCQQVCDTSFKPLGNAVCSA